MTSDLDFALRTLAKVSEVLHGLATDIDGTLRALGYVSSDFVTDGYAVVDGSDSGADAVPMSITATAARLGCSRQLVALMLDAGVLPFVMIGKRRRIPVAAVDSYLGGHRG